MQSNPTGCPQWWPADNRALIALVPNIEGTPEWSRQLFVLNIAAPKGALDVKSFARRPEVAESLRRRGLIVLFSDLLDEPLAVAEGLKQIRNRGHDMIVFHVLDREERTFPFERSTRFVGLEGMPEVTADPEALRRAYLDELAGFEKTMRRSCLANRIDFVPMDTSESLGTALSAYLSRRDARRRR